MLYTKQDFYNAVVPYDYSDIEHFIDACNKWDITPAEVHFYVSDNRFDMNSYYYALYTIRLERLSSYMKELIETYTLKQQERHYFKMIMAHVENPHSNLISPNYYYTSFNSDLINSFDHCCCVDSVYLQGIRNLKARSVMYM